MRTNRKTTILIATLTTTAWALAGCGGQPSTNQAGKSPSPTPSVAGLPAGVVNATAVPTAVPNNTATRKNVTISACHSAQDGWQASGTATNPDSKKKTDYTVTVFFTTSGGTVIGTGQTHLTVKPGANQPWDVTAAFHPAKDTRCVLRGVG